MAVTFMGKLAAKVAEGKHLCVGLDPAPEKHPPGVSVLQYLFAVVDATIDIAACYKPNIGFFESRGLQGLSEYMAVVAYIQQLDPDMPIIGDWKRGDIGATNEGYVTAAFVEVGVDALTISPYLGLGAAADVFLRVEGKTAIVLCRTTNPGAKEFQDLMCQVPGEPILGQEMAPLYQIVARNVADEWSKVGSVGLVAGATFPEELQKIREIAPGVFLLIPGIGKQKGDLEASVSFAYNPEADADFVINVSSAVLYAYVSGPFQCDPLEFARAAGAAAEDYDRQIREIVGGLKAA